MLLELIRVEKTTEYTIGELYIDGHFECYTIEDTVRDSGIKVYGETAIPTGTYSILLTYSPRFGKYLPLLVGVPSYTGIRIHSGNTALDTLGCIIVGSTKGKGFVGNSRTTFSKLYAKLLSESKKSEEIEITIK